MAHPAGVYTGIDVHQKRCEVVVVDQAGNVVETAGVWTTRASLTRWFSGRERMRICLEAGGSSPWVDRLLREIGHEVIVVNPHRVRLIAESTLKTDRVDAEVLAQLARLAPDLFLRPVTHRGEATQKGRAMLRVRYTLVKSRTASVNAVRGLLRSFGYVLPKGDVDDFCVRFQAAALPDDLRVLVGPLVETIGDLTRRIEALGEEVEKLCEAHPETAVFQEIDGVGPVVSLAFVLCVEDPKRFKRCRNVGAYLGLRPKLRSSGERSQQGRITKEGDSMMRWLLVQAAHGLLRSKADSALKRWGKKLEERIGRSKAVVAVARKLAVVMLRVWQTGEVYRPFPRGEREEEAAGATAAAAGA